MSQSHPLIGCTCPLCHTWRRVGFLLARADHSWQFRDWALRRVRELFTELLDASEGLVVASGPPVAAGGVAAVPLGGGVLETPLEPPVIPPERKGEAPGERSEENKPGDCPPPANVGPAQATSKAVAPAPPEGISAGAVPATPATAAKEEEPKSPTAVEECPQKEKKKKKDKKEKKHKHKEEKPKPRPEPSLPRSVPDFSRSSETPPKVREEEEESSEEKKSQHAAPVKPLRRDVTPEPEGEKRSRSRGRGRRSRSRRDHSRSRRRRRDIDSRSRGRRRRSRSADRKTPARSSGHLPPPEPLIPPQRGPPGIAPPPSTFYSSGWWPQRQWSSKGVKRRARAADIRHFGPDPERKFQREQRERGIDERTWEDNLKESDENAELRRRQEAWETRQPKGGEAQEEASSSREEKKKKKQSKEKKKEKRAKEQKIGGRSIARKDLKSLYSGTGLDPDPKVRKRLKRKIRRRLRRTKDTSSTSSRSSTEDSSEGVQDEILEDRSKVQKVAEMAPGALAAASVQSMKVYVLQATGTTWSQDEDSLPPIMSQYTRQFLAGRSSGGLLREAVTLSHIGDLLLMGRPAEALDAAGQRLKSLELTMMGQPWTTAQKIETVPALDAAIASRPEIQLAQREALLDSRSRGSASTWDKGKVKGKGKEQQKGKEKGKGQTKNRDEGKKTS
eukprot:s76_g26.t1